MVNLSHISEVSEVYLIYRNDAVYSISTSLTVMLFNAKKLGISIELYLALAMLN